MNTHKLPQTDTGRRALRVDEFCERYAVGRTTAYAMIKAGELRSVVVGGRRLIPVDVAEALLAGVR